MFEFRLIGDCEGLRKGQVYDGQKGATTYIKVYIYSCVPVEQDGQGFYDLTKCGFDTVSYWSIAFFDDILVEFPTLTSYLHHKFFLSVISNPVISLQFRIALIAGYHQPNS